MWHRVCKDSATAGAGRVPTSGMKTPVMVAVSPGLTLRVSSPITRTVMDRGMWPMGTWSASSWIFSSCEFIDGHMTLRVPVRWRHPGKAPGGGLSWDLGGPASNTRRGGWEAARVVWMSGCED